MTHEEEEEMQHDISKLQDQVQQLSLTQKGTESKMDGLKKGVEAKMDYLKKGVEAKMIDVEAKMDDLKIDLKTDMDELKINMNKLLQEMGAKGERVLKETHDENERNVNHDSIDANVGSKTHHIPKIDMRKFDGNDPATWMLQWSNSLISIMCKTHKRYLWKLYIWNQISLYGINGFALVKNLSLGQCLRKNW